MQQLLTISSGQRLSLCYLHSKTCVAELWRLNEPQKVLPELCAAAAKGLGAEQLNVAFPKRQGWLEALQQLRLEGVPLAHLITDGPRTGEEPEAYLSDDGRRAAYIRHIAREAQYLLAPETAGVYWALQCHRIARAEATPTLLLALQDPLAHRKALGEILKVPEEEVSKLMLRGRKQFLEFG